MWEKDFLWGVSSSSAQIEGGAYEDGKGLSVWDIFGKQGKIYRHQTADVACDSYHRYKQDIKLIKELGVKVYRLSFSWPRIMPNGYDGKINPRGLEYYDNVINECLKNGITPYVTLFHWDLPYEIFKKGGWLNKDISSWFANYTKVVVEHFKGRVFNYIPINEPECVIGGLGGTDPDRKYTTKETLTMVHNLLLAHGKSCIELRKYKDIKIGTAICGEGGVPAINTQDDIEASYKYFFRVEKASPWSVSLFADPIIFGDYPKQYYEIHNKEDLPDFGEDDFKIIKQELDFLGFNNYFSWKISSDKENDLGYKRLEWEDNRVYTRGGTWPVVPEGMYWLLKFLYQRYNLPIIITENGTPSFDLVSEDGQVHDQFRIEFLTRYLKNAEKAKQEGVDLKGYFFWSILDNLEWFSGYQERFGLVHVDFLTLGRIPKDSYYFIKEFIKNNK